ncbi:transcription antitermination factor NusB [Lactococcus insecticola]|uniref:Transcription antitermination protein NusB n=1 Tax=Pseudolactococcus insecticola TaxID=2709158 RepID=A0A6A0B7A9_9LACT|nr:transcription antitermination factor NusB [Lactococcus insecticola]GFH39627.1 hypothetical protein Hs20B_00250 [Lactococcus insecticola]
MSTKPLSQHEIRIRAIQALYLLEVQPDETVEDAMTFALTNDDRLELETSEVSSPKPVKTASKKSKAIRTFTPDGDGVKMTVENAEPEVANLPKVLTNDVPEIHNFIDNFDEVNQEGLSFLMSLVYGVRAKKAELDRELSTHLQTGWSMTRLVPVNRVILRLGAFEIKHATTPRVVAINEAIELAKSFNDEKDAKFINAVLSKVTEPEID